MLPVVTPEEMRQIDNAAHESEEVLIERAGYAIAAEALRMMGGGYGRRVTIIAGKGNNGNDGRAAARYLRRRGIRCNIQAPDSPTLPKSNLVIDAAFGTGFRDSWRPPSQPQCRVLAVDIPSGIDGLTGHDTGSLQADTTVTFGALKPGLLLQPGASRSGEIKIVDLGLDIGTSKNNLITDDDAAKVIATRSATAHKWTNAVRVVAGSPQMTGAARLVTHGALRAGSGMVVASSPNTDLSLVPMPQEAVTRQHSEHSWHEEVLEDLHKFAALVIGPGLETDQATMTATAELISRAPVPVVIDAGALTAVATHPGCLSSRSHTTVLTPHDGEFETLTGMRPAVDRMSSLRRAIQDCTVLLKGPTTLVSNPLGSLFFVSSGDQRLATAGSGDVLAGIIGALIEHPEEHLAAAVGAHWHGHASLLAEPNMTAGDLPDLLAPARSVILQK